MNIYQTSHDTICAGRNKSACIVRKQFLLHPSDSGEASDHAEHDQKYSRVKNIFTCLKM